MRKAVPGKASSTRLSISQKRGVVVEGKGLWRSHQKTCSKLDATQARGGGFRLNLEGWASRVRTPAASPGDWKPESPSFRSSCPPFSPSLPFIHIFLQFCRNCILHILFSFYISFAISFSSLTYLLGKFLGVSFICPDLSFRFQNTVFNMQLIYQREVRDTLTKITPGSYRQVRQVSVKSKIIMKINEYLSDCNSLLLSIIISALTDNFF